MPGIKNLKWIRAEDAPSNYWWLVGSHDDPPLSTKIDNELESLIKQTTEKAYIDFKCKGIIRCDFIYYEGNIYLNEINAIPGSLAFYLWTTKGYDFKSLLDEIIKESIHSCLTN